MLRVSVLGPVEAARDGQPLLLPGGKTSELLVRLALDAGVRVSSDRLIEDLWADEAVRTGRNTLQSKVSRLRRALQRPDLVVSDDGGYRLALDADDVDALAVPRRGLEAARLLQAGDLGQAIRVCRETLAMYRGDVLAGTGEWAVPHRARLEAAQLALLEIELHGQLQLGDPGVIAGAEAAVAQHPYHEPLWVVLITALYRAGRQADALAAHQRIRELLADELGLLPGPELAHLEHQILDHDPALAATGPRFGAASERAPAGNLPSMAGELVGRDREVAEIGELLAENRLVEIVGPGGMGKTAVAIATGRTLTPPDGVWLVRLEMATNHDEVVDTLVAALNVTGGEAALVERIRSADVVVILDNCEHVLDAAADVAVRLLDAAPALRLLCTSQAPLSVDGEVLLELTPLPLGDAVELFTRRAARQRTQRRAADTDEAVGELCRSLDGLPLAIELAAARTRTLTVEDISRRLDDRFALLRDPASRKPERRRALGATLQWSYDLLFPDDQRGLWALATFPGGAAIDAVEAVLAALAVPATAAIDVVGRLASRSLLIVDDDDTAARPRYRLLDSIRAFSLDAMTVAEQSATALDAHARWYAQAAAASTAGVRGPGQQEFLRFAAIRAGQHRRRPRLVGSPRPAESARHRHRLRMGVGRARRQSRRPTPA